MSYCLSVYLFVIANINQDLINWAEILKEDFSCFEDGFQQTEKRVSYVILLLVLVVAAPLQNCSDL